MVACRHSEMGASGPLKWQSVAMESDELTGSVSTPNVGIREYASADYSACRMLWVELTEHIDGYTKTLLSGATIPGVRSTTISLYQNEWHLGWPISMVGLSVLRACLIAAPVARSNRSSLLIVSVAGGLGDFLSNG